MKNRSTGTRNQRRMPYLVSYFVLVLCLANIFHYEANGQSLVEICDNGIDDDGDGLIDLNDPDCECQQAEPPSHIPNPSFEEIDCCPSGNSQLNCAVTWIQASEATTDYYNRCGYFERNGFPLPRPIPDGNAYIGFRNGRFSGENPNPNWKEYTGACLNAPLEAGTQYTFQFHIGFVSYDISPPMQVVVYGTPDCKNLPFGVGDREFGCPLNGSGWQVLGSVNVSGNAQWKQYEITTIPTQDITAIAIGPDCVELNLQENPYYFLDNLILADSERFGPKIGLKGNPCSRDFSIVSSARNHATYQWYRDGVALVGETDRELRIDLIEGSYQIMINTPTACIVSEPYDYIIPTFETESRVTVCPEETYPFGGQILSQSGQYTHTFQSKDGCDSTVHLDLHILADRVDTANEYFFRGETFRMGPYSFRTPVSTQVSLVSSLQCDSLVHLNLQEYDLYIPNAFSPNDDGVNDVFTVYGRDDLIELESIHIFDRWGDRVFEGTKGQSMEWNGTSLQGSVDGGIYAYQVEVILHDGKRKTLSGDVLLIR